MSDKVLTVIQRLKVISQIDELANRLGYRGIIIPEAREASDDHLLGERKALLREWKWEGGTQSELKVKDVFQ